MARQKHARVWWTVEDITERAREYEVELTTQAARHLLELNEKRLEETMIAAGWTVIEDALSRGSRTPRNPIPAKP
jgi:hypothetical protein